MLNPLDISGEPFLEGYGIAHQGNAFFIEL